MSALLCVSRARRLASVLALSSSSIPSSAALRSTWRMMRPTVFLLVFTTGLEICSSMSIGVNERGLPCQSVVNAVRSRAWSIQSSRSGQSDWMVSAKPVLLEPASWKQVSAKTCSFSAEFNSAMESSWQPPSQISVRTALNKLRAALTMVKSTDLASDCMSAADRSNCGISAM